MGQMIRVTYLNQSGNGFAEQKEIPADMTIGEFLAKEGVEEDNYTIRVNGEAPVRDAHLTEGDYIAATVSNQKVG